MRQRRHFFRFCRKVHTVSKTLRRQLIELGFSQDKIVAVPNGVDTDYFSPGISRIARRELRLPPGGPVLGIVGRLAPSKRHDVMLAAFEQFNRERPEAQLLVVGGGPEEERIIRLARSNKASDRIHLAGFQKDLRPYYRAMHLLLAPSTVEGLSNVILESMSCGVPVLAHTACGTSELIESDVNGFAADLENPRSILQRLQQIFAAPGRLTTIASRARNSVVKTFLLANMVNGYERLYRESARKEY